MDVKITDLLDDFEDGWLPLPAPKHPTHTQTERLVKQRLGVSRRWTRPARKALLAAAISLLLALGVLAGALSMLQRSRIDLGVDNPDAIAEYSEYDAAEQNTAGAQLLSSFCAGKRLIAYISVPDVTAEMNSAYRTAMDTYGMSLWSCRAKPYSVWAKQLSYDEAAQTAVEEFKGIAISEKGRVFDLIVPIVVLIIFSILGMLYAGGFFKGVDFATAVGENPVFGLCIGVCVSLVVAAIMFLPRKLMTLSGYMEGISEGVRSMVGAIMILVLAWSLGGTCRYLLGTGEFVSGFLNSIGVGLALLPAVIFVVAAFIGFAMGTSWGTIALILPIVIGVFPADNPLFLVAIGATLGGAVYGDHVSPISDTTILSSAGAQCNHLRHVATQLPYASVVAVICLVGYLIAGFSGNPWISLVVGAVLMVAAVLVLNKSRYGALKD